MPESERKRIAVILGASGLVGEQLLGLLLESTRYGEVRALLRRSMGLQHAKLREHVVDFDKPDSLAPLLRAHDVFCCLGTTIKKARTRDAFYTVDFVYPVTAAKAAASNGARQFLVISAMGADARSRIFYNRVKGEMEEAVRRVSFEAVHIFRPSLLLGGRREFRPGEIVAGLFSRLLVPFMVGPLRKYRPIQARAVARAMMHVASADMPGGIYESDRIQELSVRAS